MFSILSFFLGFQSLTILPPVRFIVLFSLVTSLDNKVWWSLCNVVHLSQEPFCSVLVKQFRLGNTLWLFMVLVLTWRSGEIFSKSYNISGTPEKGFDYDISRGGRRYTTLSLKAHQEFLVITMQYKVSPAESTGNEVVEQNWSLIAIKE